MRGFHPSHPRFFDVKAVGNNALFTFFIFSSLSFRVSAPFSFPFHFQPPFHLHLLPFPAATVKVNTLSPSSKALFRRHSRRFSFARRWAWTWANTPPPSLLGQHPNSGLLYSHYDRRRPPRKPEILASSSVRAHAEAGRYSTRVRREEPATFFPPRAQALLFSMNEMLDLIMCKMRGQLMRICRYASLQTKDGRFLIERPWRERGGSFSAPPTTSTSSSSSRESEQVLICAFQGRCPFRSGPARPGEEP